MGPQMGATGSIPRPQIGLRGASISTAYRSAPLHLGFLTYTLVRGLCYSVITHRTHPGKQRRLYQSCFLFFGFTLLSIRAASWHAGQPLALHIESNYFGNKAESY